MRVLVVAAPLQGHLLPLVPLATALRDAGHEVAIASCPADTGGVPVHDVAPGFRFDRIALRTMARHPLAFRAEVAGTAGTRVVGLMFGAVNDGIVDPVVETALRFRPDVVVHEPLAPAGAIAAAVLGAPAVLVENALFPGPEVSAAVVAQLGGALRRHRIGDLPEPAMVVTVRPRSLGGTHRPMRPAAPSGGDAPEWLLRPADRPRILVSRSTVAGPPAGDPMPPVAAAADAVDAEIVLVRPTPKLLRRPLPTNVRTVGWVPMAAALPHAAGVVHHAGAGSVLAAGAAGIPQLATRGPGDRTHNAELLAGTGAGLAVSAADLDAAALTRLITDEGLARSAREIAAEIAAMPPPEDLVPDLEALAD